MVDASVVIRLADVFAQMPHHDAAIEKDVSSISGVLQRWGELFPAADLLVGGAGLIFIVMLHGTAMRMVQLHAMRRAKVVALRPTLWRADLLLAGAVAFILGSHLLETALWTALLVRGNLVYSWRDAGYFAANTYTTLGYGTVVLANQWRMLSPLIAISGLFTFGWSGSVLVDVVGRVSHLRELADERRSRAVAPEKHPGPELPPADTKK